MNIAGVQKVTTMDYPGKLASIVFLQGCNMICPYCHNSELITVKKTDPDQERLFFEHLEARKGIIEGVVISGGEPTIQPDLPEFIQKIKEMGFYVKLDTNGTNYTMLYKLIDQELIDYVAMDIKSDLHGYSQYFHKNEISSDQEKLDEWIKDHEQCVDYPGNSNEYPLILNIISSVSAIVNNMKNYEFRTTIASGLHTERTLLNICSNLCSWSDDRCKKYVLQNYRANENVLCQKGLSSFTNEELDHFEKELKLQFSSIDNISIRR